MTTQSHNRVREVISLGDYGLITRLPQALPPAITNNRNAKPALEWAQCVAHALCGMFANLVNAPLWLLLQSLRLWASKLLA